MFLTKVTGAAALMLTACILACGVFLFSDPATASGQKPAEEKGPPRAPAGEATKRQPAEKRAAGGEVLSRALLARRAKAATALVEVKGRGRLGSAFCVHPAGLFLTNAHLLQGEMMLVLRPGQAGEQACPAAVVRTDPAQDLALLRVEGTGGLAALPLGPDAGPEELDDVWAFGCALGPAPAFCACPVSVRALPVKNGQPPRIQLNAALDGGQCGGPVLDGRGRVVGVLVGVQGPVSFVIPVASVVDFLAPPEVHFEPPLVGPANLHRPVCFEARVTPLLPSAGPLAVDLVLKPADSRPKPYPMQADGDTYRVMAVPLPGLPGRFPLRFQAQFDDGLLEASAADRVFRVGAEEVKLSEVRSMHLGAAPQVLLHDDKLLKGTPAGLDAVPLRLGGQTLTVDLARAEEVTYAPAAGTDRVTCVLVVRQGGKEVYRQSRPAAYTFYNVQSGFSNRYLAVRDVVPKDNADILQSERDLGKQQWRLVPSDRHPGCFHIQFQTTDPHKYLHVFQGNKAPGTRACLALYHPDQVWRIIPADRAGTYWIQSELTGLNLDVLGLNPNEGAVVGQAARHPQEVWRFKDPK
jgi:hypothetical protein